MINLWVGRHLDSHLHSACKLPFRRNFRPSEIDQWVAICKTMTRLGAKINKKDHNGVTPLCHVMNWPDRFFQESCELCVFLLQNGADVNETCNDGESILHHASHNFALTKLLLHHGAAWDSLQNFNHRNESFRAVSHENLNVTHFCLRDKLGDNLSLFPHDD